MKHSMKQLNAVQELISGQVSLYEDRLEAGSESHYGEVMLIN